MNTGSGQALKRKGRQLFPPSDLWKQVVEAPSGFLQETKTFGDALGLPKSVTLLTQNGQPVFQYRVLASTNVLGWQMPLEFWMVQYRPHYVGELQTFATNAWELDFCARGKINTVGPGRKPQISPNALKVEAQ